MEISFFGIPPFRAPGWPKMPYPSPKFHLLGSMVRIFFLFCHNINGTWSAKFTILKIPSRFLHSGTYRQKNHGGAYPRWQHSPDMKYTSLSGRPQVIAP